MNGWNEISNPELSAAVERLYKQVGVFYANKETRQLKKAEGRKDIEIVMEQKGFGFNAIWVVVSFEHPHSVFGEAGAVDGADVEQHFIAGAMFFESAG